MTFLLRFDTDNDAFIGSHDEVARILRQTAAEVDLGKTEGNVRDINGTTVGRYALDDEQLKDVEVTFTFKVPADTDEDALLMVVSDAYVQIEDADSDHDYYVSTRQVTQSVRVDGIKVPS